MEGPDFEVEPLIPESSESSQSAEKLITMPSEGQGQTQGGEFSCPTSLVLLRERIVPTHVISLLLLCSFDALIAFPNLSCNCEPYLRELHRLCIGPLLNEDVYFKPLSDEIKITSLRLRTIVASLLEGESQDDEEESSNRQQEETPGSASGCGKGCGSGCGGGEGPKQKGSCCVSHKKK
jgi:hypothetical protein